MRVAYLSYNSLSAPLVQSQVLPYLKRLVEYGHEFSLLTFERSSSGGTEGRDIAKGISWHPIYQSKSKFSILVAAWRALRELSRIHQLAPFDLVHARSYLPAMMARRFSERGSIPWLFDMRGFWVDEKVMKGTLRRNGMSYKWLKREESILLETASAIVSLTHRAIPRIENLVDKASLPPIAVIPTCTDVERFKPKPIATVSRSSLVFGYVGSLGVGYEGGMVQAFLESALARYTESRVLVVSHSDQGLIQVLSDRFPGRVRVIEAKYSKMPELVASMSVGISFITPDPSKDASCPTKVAEYLACGIPVISNHGIGDVNELIGSNQVGVLCSEPQDFSHAFDELDVLMDDPSALRRRCRSTAESLFSVELGAKKYAELYRRAAGGMNGPT